MRGKSSKQIQIVANSRTTLLIRHVSRSYFQQFYIANSIMEPSTEKGWPYIRFKILQQMYEKHDLEESYSTCWPVKFHLTGTVK
jgi:hypothetical protein